mgnify:CR=1 FL=1
MLHGIIKASGANISEQTISEFRGIIGEEANAAIQKRIDTTVDKNGKKVYDKEYLSKHRDEYFTMFLMLLKLVKLNLMIVYLQK